MTTKLEKPLKREVSINGTAYTLTISADGLKLVPKGHRRGFELTWQAMLSGDAAVASALRASVEERP
jgi:hypothetical protein